MESVVVQLKKHCLPSYSSNNRFNIPSLENKTSINIRQALMSSYMGDLLEVTLNHDHMFAYVQTFLKT